MRTRKYWGVPCPIRYKGRKYLGDANIEAARQFFRRAADAGLAAAALRLAATYDPAELVHLQAEGVVANQAEARRWYERARDLGATEAEGRLARLGPDTR
jgi:TPR repeat protein